MLPVIVKAGAGGECGSSPPTAIIYSLTLLPLLSLQLAQSAHLRSQPCLCSTDWPRHPQGIIIILERETDLGWEQEVVTVGQARTEQFIVYPPKKAGRGKINAFNQSIKLRLTALSITHSEHILKPPDIFYNEHNLRLVSPLYGSRHNRGSDWRWSLCALWREWISFRSQRWEYFANRLESWRSQ